MVEKEDLQRRNSSVQSLSRVRLFATPRTTVSQASLSITNSQGLTQTHVHWVGDPIQTSYPLSSPSVLALNLSQHLEPFMSQFFASDGQSIEVSVSALVLPMNIQDWFPLGWTGWISSLSKESLGECCLKSFLQHHQFFSAQLSL